MANKPAWHGLLNINKPVGLTSREVVDRVQRYVRPQKIGHAGTLDPLATGVLILCIGKATRLVNEVQSFSKDYRAVFELGVTSDTDDSTGNVQPVATAQPVSREQLEQALPQFRGDILQLPSRYSAVHVGGQRAYTLARAGEEFELTARPVRIARLEILAYEYPRLEVEIECSSGTYVRAIGRDLGQVLGCGAVMSALVRTRIGPWKLADALALENISRSSIPNQLLPLLSTVPKLTQIVVDDEQLQDLTQGRAIALPDCELAIDTRVALVTAAGELAALAELDGLRRLAPRHVFYERPPVPATTASPEHL